MKIGINLAMKIRNLVFVAAALILAACVGEVNQDVPEGVEMTIRAWQEGSDGTRTTVIDGGKQVYWEPSDEIKVFFNGSAGRFVSKNTQNATVAEFTGTLNVIVGATEGASYSTQTWGLYPYKADATLDDGTLTTILPASQTGKAGSFAKNTNITVAQSSGYGLAFYNVCGGFRFSLTQEGIKKVTFEGNNGETLAGKIKIAFADGVPVVQEVSEAETELTLTAPGAGTFETGKWYYLSSVPGTLTNGFKMVFYKESESAKLISSSQVSFTRGKFGSLSDADEGLIFKPTGGDDPNPDEVIQFKDPIAKYACVEKYDTNGDGEVSYAEAEEATSFNGLFTDWKGVESFDEISYFKNVHSLSGVFSGCNKLVSITIPDNITDLGTYAFSGCTLLTSVVLPSGITAIGNYTFQNCSSLATIDIPSTVTSIGQYAFYGCTVLTSVDLPSGLKTIGNYAFQNCQAILSVDFPASLTSIGQYAFSGCTALATASIGSSTSVGSYAFSGCTSLTSAVLSSGGTIGQYAFSGCSSLASVVLPEDMISIPAYCFQNCTKLTTITWPTALTTIGNNAFDGCRFVGSDSALQLPSSITTIGSSAFGYLRHLILPSTSAISIAANSFKDYTYLYVPASMVEMYKVRTNWSNYSDHIRPISDYPVESGGTVGQAIDLGLSVKWATWNVGASAPEEYGAYFAWGEVNPKKTYDWTTYIWRSGSSNTVTKYNTNSNQSTVDNKTILDPIDDAAYANWGGTWRMPTDAEWTELRTNCTWTWTTQNGVSGRLVTATNGNSIFLPAAGYRDGTNLYDVGSYGGYWSSSLYTGSPRSAWCVFFDSGGVHRGGGNRCGGFSVRPVCE